jgi:formylglycine-generating enzyme required for sulfatase activity/tRNA A-37 threonylcarbamoyl transferase component Bud32
MGSSSGDDAPWAFLDAMDAMASDRERGTLRRLDEYQAQFPGAGATIAEAYASIAGPVESGEGRRVGPYVLLGAIGRGGQATVSLAEDLRTGRRVALKVLDAPFRSQDDPRLRRLRREAAATARLDHPGVCAVLDAGESEGLGYLAMQLVEGETLAHRIEVARREGAAGIDPAVVVRLFEQIARAVHAAHEAGVVHRDLKPANLMVRPDGSPVVLDFGLAHDEADLAPGLTSTGAVFGTPAYMSPEQAEGRPLDRRTDVWSLGVTLYEALTLRRPFEGPTRSAILRRVREDSFVDPRRKNRAVSADLAVVVSTALERDLDRRYRTALDLAEDLRRVAVGEPVYARPPGPGLRLARWAARHPAIAVGASTVFLALAGGLVLSTKLLGEKADALRSAERAHQETTTALDEIRRLADVRRARDLLAWSEELWPAEPERIEGQRGIDAWLAAADDLSTRRALHARAAGELAAASRAQGGFKDAEAAWRHDILDELSRAYGEVSAARSSVEARRTFAATVVRRTLEDPAAVWAATIDEIADVARRPSYGGRRIAPMRGLVPVGFDPESKLAEFAVVATGEPPARDPATGKLVLTDDAALVLVLIPGGTFRMGAEPPTPEKPVGTPNVADFARANAQPLRDVTVDAFFLSKFEMTRAQWLRLGGTEEGKFRTGDVLRGVTIGLRQPAFDVSWDDLTRVLPRARLTTPSEAQWEYACRAGTKTRWWSGTDYARLNGAANLRDEGSRAAFDRDWAFTPGLFDGWASAAPVGTFRANAFGLHDTCGNVTEWCRDSFRAPQPTRSGPEALPPYDDAGGSRVVRGGGWDSGLNHCDSAFRDARWPAFRDPSLGVRPILAR